MKVSIEIECPNWMKIAAKLLAPVVLVATSGVALSVPNTFSAGQTVKAADMNANFSALESEIAALQSAKSTDEATISSLQGTVGSQGTAISQLQTVVGQIKRKGGDNGTVSCDTYCAGSQWAGWTGTCVGAFNGQTGQFVACSTNPGAIISAGLNCYCSVFSF